MKKNENGYVEPNIAEELLDDGEFEKSIETKQEGFKLKPRKKRVDAPAIPKDLDRIRDFGNSKSKIFKLLDVLEEILDERVAQGEVIPFKANDIKAIADLANAYTTAIKTIPALYKENSEILKNEFACRKDEDEYLIDEGDDDPNDLTSIINKVEQSEMYNEKLSKIESLKRPTKQ